MNRWAIFFRPIGLECWFSALVFIHVHPKNSIVNQRNFQLPFGDRGKK